MEQGERRIDEELAFHLLENVARMAPKGHHQLMQHLQESRGAGPVTKVSGNTRNERSWLTAVEVEFISSRDELVHS